MASKKFNQRVNKAVKRRIRRMENKDLLDPKKTLSGKQIKRVAGALTNIELNPSIHAYTRNGKQIGRQSKRDTKGLNKLGKQTTRGIAGAYSALAGAGQQNVAAQQATAQNMNSLTAGINQQQAATQQANETGVLGDLTAALEGNNAEMNGSDSRAQMALRMKQEQLASGQLAAGNANLANVMGASGVANAQGQLLSGIQQGTAAIASNKQMMASRIAQQKAEARDLQREAFAKAADTRALKGASRLKNIMDLRAGERTYGNERAAINIDKQGNAIDAAAQAETARHNQATEGNDAAQTALEKQQQQWEQNHPNAGSGSSGSGDNNNPRKMGGGEWKDWSAAARNVIDAEGRPPKNMAALADAVEEQEGVTWSPREKAQFIAKLKQRFGR